MDDICIWKKGSQHPIMTMHKTILLFAVVIQWNLATSL